MKNKKLQKLLLVVIAAAAVLLAAGCGAGGTGSDPAGQESGSAHIAESSASEETPDSSAPSEDASVPAEEGQTSDAAPEKAGLSESEAKALVLKDAGVNEIDLESFTCETETEDGKEVYEIEFNVAGEEYSYKVLIADGTILSKEQHTQPAAERTDGGDIGLDVAMMIALKKVPGATEEDMKIDMDVDGDFPVYEGEIFYDNVEYTFEIDGRDGTILKWEEEATVG